MPALFVSHGDPPLAADPVWTSELIQWGAAIGRPTAILIVSAHWERRPVTIGATTTVPLRHDFKGFPDRYLRAQYPAPGAPALAERVRALLEATGERVDENPERGLDHGAYVPLMFLAPSFDVPVLQISLPAIVPAPVYALGRALAPLRDEGVLLIGSGSMTYNPRDGYQKATPPWAVEFDTWAGAALARGDIDALLAVEKAPAVKRAHPRLDHYAPLWFAAGAAADMPGPITCPITGFWQGGFSKRSVQFG
ncbi:MAG: class III extradiol ring-cleavage dioxygenase [Pseudomonadota bacterium]|nr:class III extradiol ring-cleavage dioxygenase [Pseudomonadota bacterium]